MNRRDPQKSLKGHDVQVNNYVLLACVDFKDKIKFENNSWSVLKKEILPESFSGFSTFILQSLLE